MHLGAPEQLLTASTRNGWVLPGEESIDDPEPVPVMDCVVAYSYPIQREVDAIVLKGYRVPLLVIRTYDVDWKVISTAHTREAVEQAVRSMDPILHLDPLAKTTLCSGVR